MIAPMVSLRGRDFIDVADLEAVDLRRLLDRAHDIKAGRWRERPLAGRHMAMLFQRPSHRTRVSFEVAIARLGGTTTTLTSQDVQLGFRESIADAARVLDRYVDGIVARLRSHADLLVLAQSSEHPVVNALTDHSHPCQVLADVMTLEEIGDLARHRVVFIGDGNNIANSLIEAARVAGFELTVITPPGYDPDPAVVERARTIGSGKTHVTLTNQVYVDHATTAVYTDVWASMGQEDERAARQKVFSGYQVNARVMDAAPQAVFMHCLPAHRGEEVTDEVLDGPRSVVFQQAENRLYAQMALLAELFGE